MATPKVINLGGVCKTYNMSLPWSQAPSVGNNYRTSSTIALSGTNAGAPIYEYIALPTSGGNSQQTNSWASFNRGTRQVILFLNMDSSNFQGINRKDFEIGLFYHEDLPAFTGKWDNIKYNSGDPAIRVMYSASTGVPTAAQMSNVENLILVSLSGDDLITGAGISSSTGYSSSQVLSSPKIVYIGTNILVDPTEIIQDGTFQNLVGIGEESIVPVNNLDSRFQQLSYFSYNIAQRPTVYTFDSWYLVNWSGSWTNIGGSKFVIGQNGLNINMNNPSFAGQKPGRYTLCGKSIPFGPMSFYFVPADGSASISVTSITGLDSISLFSISRPALGGTGATPINSLLSANSPPTFTINGKQFYLNATQPMGDPDPVLSSSASKATVFTIQTGGASSIIPPGSNPNNQVLTIPGIKGGTPTSVTFANYLTQSSSGGRIPYFYLFDVNLEDSTDPDIVQGPNAPPGQLGPQFLLILSDFGYILTVDTSIPANPSFKFSSITQYSSTQLGTKYADTFGYWTSATIVAPSTSTKPSTSTVPSTSTKAASTGFYLIYVSPFNFLQNQSTSTKPSTSTVPSTISANITAYSSTAQTVTISAVLSVGDSFVMTSAANVVQGLTVGTVYYLINSSFSVSGSTTTSKISTTSGGTAISLGNTTASGVTVPVTVTINSRPSPSSSPFVPSNYTYIITSGQSPSQNPTLTRINDTTLASINSASNKVIFNCMQCTPNVQGGICSFVPSPAAPSTAGLPGSIPAVSSLDASKL